MRSIRFTLLVLVTFSGLLLGCESHHTSNVHRALIGHWETEREDFYFSEDQHTSISRSGTRVDSEYYVISSNEDENWIKIRVTTAAGKGHEKRLQFSRDRKSITQYITMPEFDKFDVEMSQKLIYVDARTRP